MKTPSDNAAHPHDAASAGRASHVYTIPAGQPFLAALARAVLDGNLPRAGGRPPDPLALPAITILLPTRRAARALQEAFLGQCTGQQSGKAMLLPEIRPISEGDEELTLLSGLAGLMTHDDADAEIPPSISEMERRLALTALVIKWSEAMRGAATDDGMAPYAAAGADSPAQAAALAAELTRLIDMVETEGITFDGLTGLVPETYSEHWQKTLGFLEIITKFWPTYLAERGMASPMDRRNRLIRAEARRLVEAPPAHPVIVAGVTGSIPATAELMRAVMELEQGAIVLPGLDRTLDDAAWQAITGNGGDIPAHPEHPQFGLKRLIDRLGIARNDISNLPGTTVSAVATQRAAFVGEAMRPSATTAAWHVYAERADKDAIRAAMSGISLIEAPSAQDEAEAVALILREAAETPGRTAALVSPDRLLARRVGIRLESFGIRVDDSAGRPFAKTVPGTFLDLVVEAMARNFAPTALMPLLKHPLTRLGLDAFAMRKAARALEIAAFRTTYLGRGLGGVAAALQRAALDERSGERREAAVRRLWEEDWQGAHELVNRLETAFRPLVDIYDSAHPRPLAVFARAHIAVAEALIALPEAEDQGPGAAAPPSPLWAGEAGSAASVFFAGLLHESMPALDITPRDYADLYRSLIAGENVRPRVPVHPRLAIWGPFEARLQQPDVLILGSLNDGTWPESAEPGPWLNRPMRQALGLPAPEEQIGFAAHDFTMLLGAGRVYLTRAQKMDGVPTVPSRWLMRMNALLAGVDLAGILKPEAPWLGWARHRDAVVAHEPARPPAPRPPVADRPRRMSVSGVETWIANPYAIFARHILRLEPLPRLGETPEASLRGAIVHEVLRQFTAAFPAELPPDPAAELLAIARRVLEGYTGHPRIAAFWLTRIERFARWFAATEAERRGSARVMAEVQGKLIVEAPGGPFTLTARADRIDVTEGAVRITDYKTGGIPSADRVAKGAAPQLPLEAAIAAAQGFAGISPTLVHDLRYIRASGGEPPGEEKSVIPRSGDVAALARDQLDRLAALVARFDDPLTPYAALRRQRFTYTFDDFAHLARVGEWSAEDDGAEA